MCVVLVGERERNEREGSDALLEKKAWSFQIAGTRKTKVDSRSLPGTSPPLSGGSPRSRRRSRRRRPSWREKRKKREKEDEKRDRESKDERRRFSSFAAVERANEKKKKAGASFFRPFLRFFSSLSLPRLSLALFLSPLPASYNSPLGPSQDSPFFTQCRLLSGFPPRG